MATNIVLVSAYICVSIAVGIMALRLAMRKVRAQLYTLGDYLTMGAIVFVLARLAFTHVVLIWGTNTSYVAVSVVTFSECRPFSGYWTVLPDPGVCCRAQLQLMTYGVLNIITDLMLIFLPLPLLLKIKLPFAQKFQLFFLFSLGFLIIGITIARLTENSEHSTSQADRVTYASAEILVAAFVVHAPTLYTLLRPRSDPKPMSRGIPYYISEHLRTAEDGHQTLSTLRQPVESKSQSHNANEQVADSLVDPDQEREPKTTFLDDASAKGILVTTEWFQNREVQE
ncbi:hypothetical protein MMC20_000274 [Loxospora ochrophaea]|nr:hypothetical protein [Loxospora ochrophaea]